MTWLAMPVQHLCPVKDPGKMAKMRATPPNEQTSMQTITAPNLAFYTRLLVLDHRSGRVVSMGYNDRIRDRENSDTQRFLLPRLRDVREHIPKHKACWLRRQHCPSVQQACRSSRMRLAPCACLQHRSPWIEFRHPICGIIPTRLCRCNMSRRPFHSIHPIQLPKPLESART